MNLRILSNNEFLRYASNEIDDLTSSEIERELLRRMEAVDFETLQAIEESEFSVDELINVLEAMEPLDLRNTIKLLNAITNSNIDTGALLEFIKLMDESGITEADELKEALELAQKFRAIANDVGDAFTRLTTLVTETQE